MKQLSKYFINQTYFVKKEVIYDIKRGYSGEDSCAKKAEDISEKLPSIEVKNNETNETVVYYLDSFIVDGDKFDGSLFKKTVHDDDETEITFQEYYGNLIEAEISDLVKTYFSKNFSWFKDNLVGLGIPAYALKNNGFSVSGEGFEQIDFNEDYFNEVKAEVVKEEIRRKANEVLDTYKYELVGEEPKFEVQPKGTEPAPTPDPGSEPEPTTDPTTDPSSEPEP